MTPAESLYRFLLRLYPEEHRQAYGNQMQQHARDLELEARGRGRPHVAALYLRLLGDGILNAGKEQWTVMRAASIKPVPWYAVLLAAIPGLLLVLTRRAPQPLVPLFPAIRNIYLVLLAVALPIVWRRTRQVPVWALVPLGMLAGNLVIRLGTALATAADPPGGGRAMGAVFIILNLVMAGVLFVVMLHGRRLPTAAVIVIILMVLSGLLLLNQRIFWDGLSRPFYWYLIPMLFGPSEALMLVAVGLLAARRYNVLALLVVIGGYGYIFMDSDYLWWSRTRDWPWIPLYLASMTFLFLLLAPVAFLRARTRLGRALALFIPASIFLAARVAVPYMILGPALRSHSGEIHLSINILLGLILGWILYSHLSNTAQEVPPGIPQLSD